MGNDPQIVFCASYPHFMDALEPIAQEAERRGYDVKRTDEINCNPEIAVYNDHFSSIDTVLGKLSIVTFHGVDDAYKPDFWNRERWNRFDVGLVPGICSAKNWELQSWNPLVRPSIGVFPVGWPKSDHVFRDEFWSNVEERRKALDLTKGETVLYAPTVEYGGKMLEFLSALPPEVRTVLIKHGPYDEVEYSDLPSSVNDDTEVIVLDKEDDIMTVLAMADVLVSDHSSVLHEAILVDTIPVSVTDWPISFGSAVKYPKPQEFPNFVVETKADLIERTLSRYLTGGQEQVRELSKVREEHFSNLGKSAARTMDLIDSIRGEGPMPIQPLQTQHKPIKLVKSIPAFSYHKVRYGITDRLPESTKQWLRDTTINELINKLDNSILDRG